MSTWWTAIHCLIFLTSLVIVWLGVTLAH